MRDFRDAKAMAISLRQALSDRAVTVTHSDSLELIARAFGFDNWNILAAKLEAERPVAPAPADAAALETLVCSFCRKSAREVEALLAGPEVNICSECVTLSGNILLDQKLSKELAQARASRPEAPLEATSAVLDAYADNELEASRRSCED